MNSGTSNFIKIMPVMKNSPQVDGQRNTIDTKNIAFTTKIKILLIKIAPTSDIVFGET